MTDEAQTKQTSQLQGRHRRPSLGKVGKRTGVLQGDARAGMEEDRAAPAENSPSEDQLETESSCKEAQDPEGEDGPPQSSESPEELESHQPVVDEEQRDNDTTQGDVTNPQDSEDPPPADPPAEDQVTPPADDPSEPTLQKRPQEPCWYCLRSLDSEYRPQIPQQEDSSAAAPSGGQQRVTYQTDPRPHFGVAWSSHAPGHPLWDSEGPCWGQRNQEVPNPTHTCPHCHLGLPADTLRWHEAKCLLFEELRAAKK